MTMIDPTYLRTLVDGLKSGAFQKGNPSSLPEGLVGVYEEALPPEINVNERSKFLSFFGVWALLRKEASAAFVASLLEGWTETDVLDWISMYSRWFNSPTAGTFVLYHERFRAFLLQKISQDELFERNQRIINLGYAALKNRLADEWEHYALEYQSSHLLMAAMHTKTVGEVLKRLAYDTAHWNRQIELSNEFSWSKRMLKEMLFWTLKHDKDQILECSLNKVDLHYLELNDAPKVVAMVAKGEIDLALKRIESFGGSDEEGVGRKFILFMLCLMELTLLESKDQPFRKSGIERILQHLDEQLPTDFSILNWNDFFPSYTMYLMACEWAEMDLEYSVVYKRTEDLKNDWIAEKGPYSDLQFEVFLKCARGISSDYWKRSALTAIAVELSKQGQVEESLAIARGISSDEEKSSALTAIAVELSKQGQVEESLTIAREISDLVEKSLALKEKKSHALKEISIALCKQGQVRESLTIAQSIREKSDKSIALKEISIVLSKQGQLEESLAIARGISSDEEKSSALNAIAVELSKQGQVKASASVMQESLSIARGFPDDYYKSCALNAIAIELSKQGQVGESARVMQESLTIAREISDDKDKSRALGEIVAELSEQGQMQELLTVARGISNEYYKNSAITAIAVALSKQGQVEESMTVARGISDEYYKNSAITAIAVALSKQGQVEESLSIARSISDDRQRSSALKDIAVKLSKLGQVEESLAIARGISSDEEKSSALTAIAVELSKQGQVEESLAIARCILQYQEKNSSLNIINDIIEISTIINKKEFFVESDELIKGALRKVEILNIVDKNYMLEHLVSQLIVQGKTTIAWDLIHEKFDIDVYDLGFIKLDCKKNSLNRLYKALIEKKDFYKILFINRGVFSEQEKKKVIYKLTTVNLKNEQLKHTSISEIKIKDVFELFKKFGDRQKYEDSLEMQIKEAWNIGDYHDYMYEESLMISTLVDISIGLKEIGEIGKAEELIEEVYRVSSEEILDEYWRVSTLISIYRKLRNKDFKFIIKDLEIEISVDNINDVIDNTGMPWRSNLLKEIALAKYLMNRTKTSEDIANTIPLKAVRIEYWKELAKVAIEETGWEKSLGLHSVFQSDEAKGFYLKGWAENIDLFDVDETCIQKALPILVEDSASIESLLQKYAARKIGLENPTPQSLARLNQSLNVQWLLDVKNGVNGE